VLTCLALIVSSCGYRFSGSQKAPFDIHRINVAVFENLTSEIGLETVFANDLVDVMILDGRMVLSDRRNADAVFSGIIKLQDIETVARTAGYAAVERRVTIFADVRLNNQEGEILWEGKNVSHSETYLVAADKYETEHNRKLAVQTISRQIAGKIHHQLNLNF
jgi:hypothetical protein